MSEENENVKQGTKHAAEGGIVLKKKHIVVIAIIILLLLFGGVFVGLNWNNWFGENEVQPTQTSQASEPENSVDIDPNAGDWTGSKPVDQEPSSKGIKIPGYPSITIAANTKNVTMALLNPEGNPCYFKFEIVLKDTDENIFESKYVEPGKAITDGTEQMWKPYLRQNDTASLANKKRRRLDNETGKKIHGSHTCIDNGISCRTNVRFCGNGHRR